MRHHFTTSGPIDGDENKEEHLEIDSFLHPAQAFACPFDVVNDPDLTLSEKRAILASWASDACAVEAAPGLRRPPSCAPVRFGDIMDALRELDQRAAHGRPLPHYRKVLSERRPGVFGRKGPRSDEDHGQPLN